MLNDQETTIKLQQNESWESVQFPMKVRVKWVTETATTSDGYDASNENSVLMPLCTPFKRWMCKFVEENPKISSMLRKDEDKEP